MNNRNYNIFFHTHTISGIIITAILYVIFFAGSFSFFKNEIENWQKDTPVEQSLQEHTDYKALIDTLDAQYGLYGRDVVFYFQPHKRNIYFSLSPSKDTLNPKADERPYAGIDLKTRDIKNYREAYSLGEFLYRLHFLAPVNSLGDFGFPLGYYIAGGVAFLFLFALITGVLVHWQKIISNFYLFRPWEKLKTVWTDLHTALGVISFPYLFVFSVTGAYFLISYPLFTQPTIKYQFDDKTEVVDSIMGYKVDEYTFAAQRLAKEKTDLAFYMGDALQKWGTNTTISSVRLLDYGDQNMHVIIEGQAPKSSSFNGKSKLVYQAADGKVLERRDPFVASSYRDVINNIMYILHFGNFGGYATKVLYFLLGISGCVVIISGVMIWLVARDKKNIPEKKRKFNEWLVHIYLAICLSMYPVTAASFIAVKLQPDGGQDYIYKFYFWAWLLVAVVLLLLRRNHYKMNRDCLLAGSIIGISIPAVNGLKSGNWMWVSYRNGFHDILLIDVFWLLTAIATFICWWLVVRKHKRKLTAKA